MNNSKIYLRAAKLVDAGIHDYSCIAIISATRFLAPKCYSESMPRRRYSCMFSRFDGFELSSEDVGQYWGKTGRVIALCFAAAMAEAGDL